MSTNVNFVKQVLYWLKDADEAKILRLANKSIKHCKTQISQREGKIEDLNDEIDDLKEAKDLSLYKVELSELKDVASTKDYVERYVQGIFDADSEIDAKQALIEEAQAQIERFKSVIKSIAEAPEPPAKKKGDGNDNANTPSTSQ